MIQSVDNPKIKEISKLLISKYRKKEKKFLVEGKHLVEEAKKIGVLIEAFSTEEKEGYTQVSQAVMKKISNTDTLVKEVGLCKFIEKNILTNHILILDGVQDPGNMGTLLRSACAFGFKTVFISNLSVDIYNDKVIRASQGAIFKLNFLFGETKDFILQLKEYKVFGTNVMNGKPLETIQPKEKMALVLGNEGNGISKEVQGLNLENIYIPMDNTESLNVAIAGSIIMYHLR
ncbi:MAG: RNA methyltransferase [Anaeroplasmataceae bacterium]|nr:RNA methyltransferase [Anaeroplasmataceae bacterium]